MELVSIKDHTSITALVVITSKLLVIVKHMVIVMAFISIACLDHTVISIKRMSLIKSFPFTLTLVIIAEDMYIKLKRVKSSFARVKPYLPSFMVK
jgi:hypothetical protein